MSADKPKPVFVDPVVETVASDYGLGRGRERGDLLTKCVAQGLQALPGDKDTPAGIVMALGPKPGSPGSTLADTHLTMAVALPRPWTPAMRRNMIRMVVGSLCEAEGIDHTSPDGLAMENDCDGE